MYIMRQIKKITLLQACFLGDVRVIWCNSSGDNHFQIYVMNNVEIVIDYYLLITPHVSHVFTSCTHFTSYSLLSFVHEIVCESSLAIQDYVFCGIWCKIWLRVWKSLFWSSGWKLMFLKIFGIILMHYMSWKIFWKLILQKNFWFFKKSIFQNFDRSNLIFDQ